MFIIVWQLSSESLLEQGSASRRQTVRPGRAALLCLVEQERLEGLPLLEEDLLRRLTGEVASGMGEALIDRAARMCVKEYGRHRHL